ncbi:MAG: hypothetical protein KAG56_03510 [Sulfurovaceae bacterium]|nr:hypothetical protein [Sulfurovaceae bacterium]
MFGWLFGKKKKQGFNPGPQPYSVQQDPAMTRWDNYYCETCQEVKRHKVMRVSKGHKRASVQCRTCLDSFGMDW